ncbi:hypothetical protein BN2497_11603 [Janthinobacterium sp. CG23_2]|nr:hypothetical protein BN2497_11603 [Janthinobacterium sp. CG23_2]CUU32199.1 hypothetical protein BN3177_11603 [Janthinobacterium sp. CG23_2]
MKFKVLFIHLRSDGAVPGALFGVKPGGVLSSQVRSARQTGRQHLGCMRHSIANNY